MNKPYSNPIKVKTASKKRMYLCGIALSTWSCGGCIFAGFVLFTVLIPPWCCVDSETALKTSCMSNVRQLGLSLKMYEEDYNGKLPIAKNWMNSTLQYTRGKLCFACPIVKIENPSLSQVYGYAFNSDLSTKKMGKFSRPDQTQTIYDSTNLMYNASDPLTSLPRPGRHKGMNVIGYLDGHAKSSYSAEYTPGPTSGKGSF